RLPAAWRLPYTTLFRSGPVGARLGRRGGRAAGRGGFGRPGGAVAPRPGTGPLRPRGGAGTRGRRGRLPRSGRTPGAADPGIRALDRKSTRLNSSHVAIS